MKLFKIICKKCKKEVEIEPIVKGNDYAGEYEIKVIACECGESEEI